MPFHHATHFIIACFWEAYIGFTNSLVESSFWAQGGGGGRGTCGHIDKMIKSRKENP